MSNQRKDSVETEINNRKIYRETEVKNGKFNNYLKYNKILHKI